MSRAPHRAAGFSLVEMMIVLVVVSALTVMIAESLTDLSRTQSFQRGQTRLADHADRVVRQIEADVSHATKVFTSGDPDLMGYVARLALPLRRLARGYRLPRIVETAYFEPDAAEGTETGNLIFIGRADGAVTASLPAATAEAALPDPDAPPPAATEQPYRVDTLVFIVYFLERREPGRLDLSRWGSRPLARYPDIDQIADPVRKQALLRQLHAAGIRHAWHDGNPADEALFEIRAGGVLAPFRAGKVPEDPALSVPGFVGKQRMQIATNGSVPRVPVPLFARPEPRTGFPAGFEVKVSGIQTGKLMLVRLTVTGLHDGSMRPFASVSRLVSCRDG